MAIIPVHENTTCNIMEGTNLQHQIRSLSETGMHYMLLTVVKFKPAEDD